MNKSVNVKNQAIDEGVLHELWSEEVLEKVKGYFELMEAEVVIEVDWRGDQAKAEELKRFLRGIRECSEKIKFSEVE